jgi:uncharacterized 2Fe-2S/4Fe-4S cluster protein (DUF4445 family)
MPDLVHGSDRRPLTPGASLYDAAAELGSVVPASCRRTGRCHECVVEVRAGGDQLSPRTAEEGFLGPAFRLACQAQVERADRDLEFSILRRRLRILLAPDGDGAAPAALDPTVSVGPDGHARGDDGRDLGVIGGAPVGVAIDIGTTTVVLELADLTSGALLAVSAIENPQRFGGSDVMTRISYEEEVPGELRAALRRALNHELKRLGRETGIERRRLVDAVIVGNPTMRDLALGVDVSPLGRMPYRSVTETEWRAGTAPNTSITRRAHEAGLLLNPQARVWGGPLIACHVGADAAADVIAVEAMARGGSFLIVDIGTNSEIVASDGTRVMAASSPAGPAFEGGGVRYGMPGADGAIEGAHWAGDHFAIETIGDAPPEGICGSGLVELLAEARAANLMSNRGRFADGHTELVVTEWPRITLSRADVGHLAVAKAATSVGQRVLLRRLGLAIDQVDRVYLAGGFANALDIEAAIAIGLLINAPREGIIRAGNASIAGARSLLLSRRRRQELEALVGRIEHVELEAEPDFFDLFTDGCMFEPISA